MNPALALTRPRSRPSPRARIWPAPLGRAHHRHRGGGCSTRRRRHRLSGAALLAVSGEAFAQARYATDAAACEALCRAAHATHRAGAVQFAFRARRGGRRAPAGRRHRYPHHGHRRDADSIEARAGSIASASKPYSARETRPWFLLLDAGTCAPFAGGSAHRQAWNRSPWILPAMRTTVQRLPHCPRSDAQTIRPDAKLLFVAGAGWTKKQPDGQVHADEAAQLILVSCALGRFAGQQQIARRSGRRRPAGASLSYAHEPDRPDRAQRRATPRASRPAAMAKNRTWWAGASSASGAPSRSIPTAAGRAARPTWSTSRMRSR